MANKFKLWIRAMRAPFFQAMIIPSLLGAAIAWHETGIFYLGYFLLSLAGAICINAGTNLSNDYFDHKTRVDEINDVFTPFSGGSRVIQEGLISPKKMLIIAMIFFGLGSAIGLYLTFVRGWTILVIGAIGVLSCYLYTAPPVKAVYRGWGELLAGFNAGPLVVWGTYYVQVQHLGIGVMVASIPIGFIASAILYINQFSDYEPDKAANKKTLIVRLGPARAVKGYYFLIIGVYLAIIVGCLLRIMPWISLITLLSIPLAWKAVNGLRLNYAGTKEMIPAMASNIQTHLLVGLLLSCSYVINGFLR